MFTMAYKRGDVLLALFPDSNLQTAKLRPVLVVQADNLNTGLAQTVVAMISSNLARAGHPSRILVSLATPAGQQAGLRTDSVIMTDNLATILDKAIDRAIGVWGDMAAVDAALRHTLKL
jgi:mRNA interferase MazF